MCIYLYLYAYLFETQYFTFIRVASICLCSEADLELLIHLPVLLKFWDYRLVPTFLSLSFLL